MLRGWADPTDSQKEGWNIGWAPDYEFLLIVGSGRAAILKSMGVWVEAHRKWATRHPPAPGTSPPVQAA